MFLEPRRKKKLPYFFNPLSFFEVTLSTSLSISALKVVSWSVAKGSTRGITLATSFKTNVQNIKKKKYVSQNNSNYSVTCDEKAMYYYVIILILRADNW